MKCPLAMVETYSRNVTEHITTIVSEGQMQGPSNRGLDSRVEQQDSHEPLFLAFPPFGIILPIIACQ